MVLVHHLGVFATSVAFFALLMLTLAERGQGPLSSPTTRVIALVGSPSLGYVLHSSVAVALSPVAALLSWDLLELPFLLLKSQFEYRSVAKSALSGTMAPAIEAIGRAGSEVN